jgi:hypothetical protein
VDKTNIRYLSDDELWKTVERLADSAREAAIDLAEALSELDRRGLPERSPYASLHAYCTQKLLMTDASAYRYIRAARALRLFPPLGPALRNGRISFEAIVVLHPFLKDPDASDLVADALGKSIGEIERLVAPRRTEEPRKDVVRLIAAAPAKRPSPAESDAMPAAPPIDAQRTEFSLIPNESPAAAPPSRAYESREELYASVPPASPVSPSVPARHHVRIGFTADESFAQLLEEVQAAMRHKYPDGRLEGIFRDALKALLKKNRPWATPKPAPRGAATA